LEVAFFKRGTMEAPPRQVGQPRKSHLWSARPEIARRARDSEHDGWPLFQP
jgi:hypothetical protein